MDYSQARNYLTQAKRYAGEMGLANVKNLLEKVGHPEADLKFIHIAGTNGKGSVMAYVSTVLTCAGYQVGRYVSPTLYSYRECIQINGNNITREDFTKHMVRIIAAIHRMEQEGLAHPSPFEIETVLAMMHFQEQGCDMVVLECGMGGSMDATNVIANTVLAVITSISMDHMDYLGDTLEKIAMNKAGIIKPGAAVVIGKQEQLIEEAIWALCTEKGNPLVVAKPQEAVIRESTIEKQTFRYHGEEVTITMAGSHQIENAVLALECIQTLNQIGYTVTKEEIQQGFLKTRWNGRFTVIKKEPYVVVDGAHNPDAALKLKQSIEMYFPEQGKIFIMGVFGDKQYDRIAKILTPLAKQVYTIETPDNERALKASELASVVEKYNSHVQACKSIGEAVNLSLAGAGKDGVVIAFGSLSFIGEITRIVTGEEEYD